MNVLELLQGKKSYIIAAAIILTALGAFLNGDVTLVQAIETVLAGLGLASLRAGIAGGPKV